MLRRSMLTMWCYAAMPRSMADYACAFDKVLNTLIGWTCIVPAVTGTSCSTGRQLGHLRHQTLLEGHRCTRICELFPGALFRIATTKFDTPFAVAGSSHVARTSRIGSEEGRSSVAVISAMASSSR
mmetsp:Transcript_22412/g.42089  ORF Transcript_22412/g.42089 Transcript_22412/m.42089 type:complete len:126 (+) Transcript_22412:80-457(+)